MRTAVASDDERGPRRSFSDLSMPKKPNRGSYGLKSDKEKTDDDFGHFKREKAKPKKAYAAGGANPPKGPKLNNKMKVVPLKEKTIADQERQKAKAKDSLKKKTNGKKKK